MILRRAHIPLLVVLAMTTVLWSGCEEEEDEPQNDPTDDSACAPPEDLSTFTALCGRYHLTWDEPSGGSSSFYEVEYGIQGFEVGSGTTLLWNTTNTFELVLEAGNIYQFYVRAFCDDVNEWSDRAGPLSTVIDQDQYLCTAPSDVTWLVQENAFGEPTGALFDWERNGEYHHEMTISLDGQPIDESNLFTMENEGGSPYFALTQNTDYDFWIRAVCLDGSKTNWTGPTNVNIGD